MVGGRTWAKRRAQSSHRSVQPESTPLLQLHDHVPRHMHAVPVAIAFERYRVCVDPPTRQRHPTTLACLPRREEESSGALELRTDLYSTVRYTESCCVLDVTCDDVSPGHMMTCLSRRPGFRPSLGTRPRSVLRGLRIHLHARERRGRQRSETQPGRRMDTYVSMDTDAILVFSVYVQLCGMRNTLVSMYCSIRNTAYL